MAAGVPAPCVARTSAAMILAPNTRQAIIWTNADPIHWRIYAAQGGDELMFPEINWARQVLMFMSVIQILRPGDGIAVLFYTPPSDPPSFGIPYDVGAKEVCGFTSLGLIDILKWEILPRTVKVLDECWMMSVKLGLSSVTGWGRQQRGRQFADHPW